MSTAPVSSTSFHADLKSILPRLRLYALALTRDRDRADDLVQQTAVKALAGQKSFRPSTCFPAWVFRIQRNEFISGLRQAHPTVLMDEVISNALSHPAQQDRGLVMQDFLTAFGKLSPGQREALVLAVVDGQSYTQVAQHAGVSVGTVKSRISRARATLRQLLMDEEDEACIDERPSAPSERPGLRKPEGRDRVSSSGTSNRVNGQGILANDGTTAREISLGHAS